MNQVDDTEAIKSSRLKFTALVLVAFVPIAIAYVGFFYFPSMMPSATTNQGELIVPPIAADSIAEELTAMESWVLIQPINGGCSEQCESLLYLSRQVVVGLGKDTNRIRRALLTPAPVSDELSSMLAEEHKDLEVILGPTNGLKLAPSEAVYLMDPLGNIMMYFTEDKAGKPMLKDLKHLLKISNIG